MPTVYRYGHKYTRNGAVREGRDRTGRCILMGAVGILSIQRMINSLIYDVTYPMNIGAIARTAHVLGGGGKLYFYDPRGIIAQSFDEINRFSSDLFKLKEYEIVPDVMTFLSRYEGRKIVTELSPRSKPLGEFAFRDGDLILFGNERVGVDKQASDLCDDAVIIPMLGAPDIKTDYHPGEPIHGVGQYPSLSVSMAYGIVMYTALEHTGTFRSFSFG